jgi:DNA repair protein RadA/Sms
MNKSRTVFICQECSWESAKWLGRCPGCHAWSTLTEKIVTASISPKVSRGDKPPQKLSKVNVEGDTRLSIDSGEFDRVLGGGLVGGSVVLIGGAPGIGKSTIMLQVAAEISRAGSVVYVSGEESCHQIRLRSHRLGVEGNNLYLLPETDIDNILGQLDRMSPLTVFVDSVQTLYVPQLDSLPGSISQLREATARLLFWAKSSGIPVILSGHVTKEGAIAGPKQLEHIVDVVLYLEGEQFSNYRILRSAKNRFGSTTEVGIFEMTDKGLVAIANPSQIFLGEERTETIGSTVVPTLEGTRPLLVEIQALTNLNTFGQPRRTANGVDINRLLMITAVLTRRLDYKLGSQDVIVNATGGIRVDEPAVDLAMAIAIASSYRGIECEREVVAMGEIGLSGELRTVTNPNSRLTEAARLGFKKAIVPSSLAKKLGTVEGIEITAVRTLGEAIRLGLVGKRQVKNKTLRRNGV